MSLRFEMNAGIPSTYGKAIADLPRQQPKKPTSDKPVLKVKDNAQQNLE